MYFCYRQIAVLSVEHPTLSRHKLAFSWEVKTIIKQLQYPSTRFLNNGTIKNISINLINFHHEKNW